MRKTCLTARQFRMLARAIELREAELRRRIAEERERAIEGEFADVADGKGDVADQAFTRSHFNTECRKVDNLLARVRELAAARERLESGAFGVCIDCGDPIDRARLIATPASARCTTCQERYEYAQTVVRH